MRSSDTKLSALPPRIHIATQSVVPRDAIGADVVRMAEVFCAAGYQTDIWASGWDSGYAPPVSLASAEAAQNWRAGEDLLIYHHSVGWPEGEEMLAHTRCQVVVRYHNVTPPAFFEGHSEPHVEACRRGVEATRRLAQLPGARFWGDSAFNCSELIEYGAPRDNCRVLPPFHAVEDMALESPDAALAAAWRDGPVNIIFVGGFKPNKAHGRAIRVFAVYHRWINPESRLILIGSVEPAFAGYLESLRRVAAACGVADRVIFATSVSRAQLRTWYLMADVFLCVSEHEGFCVPLVEAMSFDVPIVARAYAAVPETLADAGVLLPPDEDPLLLAEAMATILTDTTTRAALVDRGRRRLKDFSPHRARAMFAEHMAALG